MAGYRVVLVDDEPIILRSLKVALPWEELGMVIVGEASNGEEGLKIIQDLKPDIVISDIRMPVLDGISMMKETLQMEPSLIFVLLSGYGEFEYAREAVRSGAFDYLLKPVDHEELEGVMREAAKRLEQEARHRSEREYLTKSVQSLSSLVRERLVSLMLEADQKTYSPTYWLHGWDLEYPYVMLVAALDHTLEVHQWSREDRRLWLFAVGNVLTEYGQENGVFTVFPFRTGEWVILVQNVSSRECEKMGRDMIELVKRCTKLECSVGISKPHEGLEQLYSCYISAQGALLTRFSRGSSQVCIAGGDGGLPGAGQVQGERSSGSSWAAKIIEAASGFDKGLAAALLGQWMAELRGSGFCSQKETSVLMIEFAVELSRRMSGGGSGGGGGGGGKGYDPLLQSMVSDIPLCSTMEEMERRVREGIWAYMDLKAGAGSSQAEIHSIRKAMDYMEERFHYDLSMDEVAEFVGLSCSHFCVLFKKESSLTFLEYLTKLRIDRACSILRNTDVKVYQIAPLVGYQDPKYFTQVFKRLVGQTPSEYRGQFQC